MAALDSMDFQERLTASIGVFLFVIRSASGYVRSISDSAGRNTAVVFADWMQSNWETIVESSVSFGSKVFLEPYGDGADCNDGSSRVWMPAAIPSHGVRIVCRRGEAIMDLIANEYVRLPGDGVSFDRFVAMCENGWYDERAPFDCVATQALGRDVVFRLEDVMLVLVAL